MDAFLNRAVKQLNCLLDEPHNILRSSNSVSSNQKKISSQWFDLINKHSNKLANSNNSQTSLLLDGFDDEQVFQQIDIHSSDAVTHSMPAISRLCGKKSISFGVSSQPLIANPLPNRKVNDIVYDDNSDDNEDIDLNDVELLSDAESLADSSGMDSEMENDESIIEPATGDGLQSKLAGLAGYDALNEDPSEEEKSEGSSQEEYPDAGEDDEKLFNLESLNDDDEELSEEEQMLEKLLDAAAVSVNKGKKKKLDKAEDEESEQEKEHDSGSNHSKRRETEVDDKFFRLTDMEAFLDREDAREESKGRVRDETDDDEEIDVFADLPSDVEGEDNGDQKTARLWKYADFFANPSGQQVRPQKKSVSFVEVDGERPAKKNLLPEDDEESDGETGDLSTHEKQQKRMKQKVSQLEKQSLDEKPWQLKGEVSAAKRPYNSLLEEDLDFETAARLGASKILLQPFPWFSHINEIGEIGRALKERGNDIYILLTESYPRLQEIRDSGDFHVLTHHAPEKDMWSREPEDLGRLFQRLTQGNPMDAMRNCPEGPAPFCPNMLSDSRLFSQLQELKLDLAIVDDMVSSRCFQLLPYKLGIPWAAFSGLYNAWLHRTPALPSFVPYPFAATGYSDRMNFWQRLHNTWLWLFYTLNPPAPFVDPDLMRRYVPERPPLSMDQLSQKAVLYFNDADFLLDFPRPVMPHEFNVGGLNTKPARPLPLDLRKFSDRPGSRGTILVSFGSNEWTLPALYIEKFAAAFASSRLRNYQIMWKYTGPGLRSQSALPSNVKIFKWLPQNDILGDNNTLLFVTHAGTNSQFEALYHGVPTIHCPIFTDQPYNSARATARGYGETIDVFNFLPIHLVELVERVAANATYRQTVERAARIFRSRRHPRERAADAVEDVLFHGGQHLHSAALDMPWFEYLMLDILGFLLFLLFLLFCIVRQLLSLVVNWNTNKQKRE